MARLVKRTPQEPSKVRHRRQGEPGKLYWYDAAGKRYEIPDTVKGIRAF